MDVLKITCAGLLATAALIAARPSLAQDAPQAPSAPPVVMEQPLPPPAPPASPPAPTATPADSATPLAQAAPAAPPPVPADPATPATPAAPAASAELATPPAPDDGDANIQIRETLRKVNGEDMKRIRVIVTQAREKARDAMAQARLGRVAAIHALQDVQPQIEAALAKVRPEIDKARVQIKLSRVAALRALKDVQPQIDAALAKAQPELDQAMAQVRSELAKENLDVKVQERVDNALKRVEIRIKARESQLKKSGHDVPDDNSDTSGDQ